MNERDIAVFKKIIGYAERIAGYVAAVSSDFALFQQNSMNRDAVAMCVLQIGELAGCLSEETKTKYDGVRWNTFRSLRNIAAHGYETFSDARLWHTANIDIPKLRTYCEIALKNLSI